jgi:opacity protein-like surface antigen
MKKIFVLIYLCVVISAPAGATPIYTGLQVGDSSVGILLGNQIDSKYAVEAHLSKFKSNITHAGVTVDSAMTGLGVTGIARFPMKLNDLVPYSLFVKAGFERTTSNETYSIPTSVTLTLPYKDKISSSKNQFILGGGAEFDFSKKVVARMGVDFIGKDKSINLAAIYKF